MGAIDSYKKSIEIVKKKPLETIVFSFALWAVNLAMAIPLVVLLMILFLGGVVGAIAILALDSTLIWILVALGIIPFIVIMFIYSVIVNAVNYSAQYTYWNKLRVR